jgi:hypothetical protein
VQLPHGRRSPGATAVPRAGDLLAVYAPGGFEAYFLAVADALAAGTPDGAGARPPAVARFGIAVSEV